MVLTVHARDVVSLLKSIDIQDVNSFDWTRQLRYYWDKEINDCLVK